MATLDELKEENRLEEEANNTEIEEKEDDNTEVEDTEAEDDSGEEGQDEDDSEVDDDDVEAESSDDWMKSEEDPADETKFTDGDVAKLRRKMRGKADKQKAESDEEIKRLTEENERLKNTPRSTEKLERPKREDFKTDEEYEDALTDHRIDLRDAKNSAANASATRKNEQQAKSRQIETDVNNHYLRAKTLAEKSGIKPEAYQAADQRVRDAVEEVFPGGGDAVVDNLISVTGKGSDMSFYHLGVNPSKLAEFTKLFSDGSNGLSAATYLGKLNAELSAPARRSSKAPAPGEDVTGDRSKTNIQEKNFKKRYDAAHKSGEGTKAFNIKLEAKKAKIDTSNWAR